MAIDRIRCYHRDGTPYSAGIDGLLEFIKDTADHRNAIVKQEVLPNGYNVSTVWMGVVWIDGGGPPLIFETLVWNAAGKVVWQEQYSTENEAILGHLRAVDKYAKAGRQKRKKERPA